MRVIITDTAGLVMPPDYPEEDDRTKEKIERIPAEDRVIPDFKLTEWEVEA